jgi:hypothetical protein
MLHWVTGAAKLSLIAEAPFDLLSGWAIAAGGFVAPAGFGRMRSGLDNGESPKGSLVATIVRSYGVQLSRGMVAFPTTNEPFSAGFVDSSIAIVKVADLAES